MIMTTYLDLSETCSVKPEALPSSATTAIKKRTRGPITDRQKLRDSFARKTKPNGACVEWVGAARKDGYGKPRRSGREMLAHRYAYWLANGEIPAGMCVCHSCDNRKCVNQDHLWLGTQMENIKDAQEKHRMPWGEGSYRAKLTQVSAERILALNGKERAVNLARLYGVSETAIRQIWSGQRWPYLPSRALKKVA